MKKTKRIISLLLVFSIFTVGFLGNISIASAQETQGTQEGAKKENFKIHSEDLNNYVYTYEESGSHYKVVEKADVELKNIHSEIYKKNSKGEYELEHTLETIRGEHGISFTTNKDGNVTTEKVNFSDSNTELKDINADNIIKLASSNWSKETVHLSTNTIAKYTMLAVTGYISGHISYLAGGPVAAGKVTSITAIASQIINDYIPTIYYRTYKSWKVDFKTMTTRTRTYVYSNSARTKLIKSPVTNYVYKNLHM